MSMTSYDKLSVREEDAIRLILEFLSRRDLCISQLSLERESGIENCNFSDDLIFLRQLILDGQWDDVLQFVSPLESFDTFSSQEFRFTIYKHKYIELLCIRSEAGSPYQTVEVAVQDIIECLNQLEKYCTNREDYNKLSSLLTILNLYDDDELKKWNPNSWRLKCFNDVRPLVEKFMQSESFNEEYRKVAKNDRLMNLIFKGLMYEVCLNSIKSKLNMATSETESSVMVGIDDNLNLNCFIQSLPETLFEYFANRNDTELIHFRNIEKHDKPDLVASWSEMILSTPIKPNVFPHTVVPYTRIKAADLMSKSLSASLMQTANTKDLMTMSVCDIAQFSRSTLAATGFHLNSQEEDENKNSNCDKSQQLMTASVDRLFMSGNVFTTPLKSITDDCQQQQQQFNKMPTINEKASPTDSSKDDVDEKVETVNSDQQEAGDFLYDDNGGECSAMDESYLNIWMNYQKEKNRILAKMNEPELNSSTPTPNGTNLNQNKSTIKSQLINAIAPSASSTPPPPPPAAAAASFDSSPNNRAIIHNTPGSSSSNNRALINQITTPVTIRSNAIRRPLTSTPKTNKYSLNSNRTELIDQSDHMLWNSPICKSKSSSSNSPTNTAAVPVACQSPIGQHGLRSSPSFSSPTPSSNPSYLHQQYHDSVSGTGSELDSNDVRFVPIASIQDQQAIRAAEFHPNGRYYAVGSNSKMLRVCRYSSQDKNNNNAAESSYVDVPEPDIMYSRQRYHKGSIYCLTWNKLGNLLATGSNDKTIKLIAFDPETETFENRESELTVHGGTVRDLCFMDDLTNGSSLLLSGGAGDCKIYITDCETNTTFISLSGHSGAILSLYTWGGAMFVSGSQDRTIRFWDLRSNSCINLVTCPTISRNKPGGAVASVSVDPSGKLLVSGYEDSTCMLYDIRGGRVIQTFHPHSSDIRTIRFSNKAYYLLSGGYDNKIVLTDLQGDLTQPLKSVVVAEHQDKVIQCRWHPSDFTFLSTSADKSAILWALPD